MAILVPIATLSIKSDGGGEGVINIYCQCPWAKCQRAELQEDRRGPGWTGLHRRGCVRQWESEVRRRRRGAVCSVNLPRGSQVLNISSHPASSKLCPCRHTGLWIIMLAPSFLLEIISCLDLLHLILDLWRLDFYQYCISSENSETRERKLGHHGSTVKSRLTTSDKSMKPYMLLVTYGTDISPHHIHC